MAFSLAGVIALQQRDAHPPPAHWPTVAPAADAGRPARTPQNDPSLSASGPRLGAPTRLRGSEFFTFVTIDGGDAVLTAEEERGIGTVAYVTKIDTLSESRELFRIVGGRLTNILCMEERYSPLCLLQEERQTTGEVGTGKSRFSLFDQRAKKLTAVEGPWGDHASMAHVALAFNGRWIALIESRAADGGNIQLVHFVEIGAKPRFVRSAEVAEEADLVAYAGIAEAPKAIFHVGSRYESIDVVRGTRAFVDPPTSSAEPTSTNGPLRFLCREHAGIDVEEIATKKVRAFEVHPDDRARLREGCGQWIDDRYIDSPSTASPGSTPRR